MISIVMLLAAGICLSALFSGSETGFYRVSRVRLVLDGIAGNRTARRLLWMTNNPSIFVATTLVGNNIANYLASLAVVLATQRFFGSGHLIVDIMAPILLAPVLFVYGESLPKSIFLRAPNRMLHLTHPLLLLHGILFAPITALLWALGRGMQKLLGRSPETVRLVLARQELEQVLLQGHQIGILKPVQHELGQSWFSIAGKPISRFVTPVLHAQAIAQTTSRTAALRMAKKWKQPHLVVKSPKGTFLGYTRVIDLCLRGDSEEIGPLRRMLTVDASSTFCNVLLKLQSERVSLAIVQQADGKVLGIVSEAQLTDALNVKLGPART
jgi:CBS domain containing-hemolysin-like protein